MQERQQDEIWEMMEENFLYEKILTDLLNNYWAYDDHVIDAMLRIPGLEIKQQVEKIDNLKVLIYSNDHLPAHFHVISNDKQVDAKFRIDDGTLISGKISTKDVKKITVFYNSSKTKLILKKIWDKRNN